MESRECPDGKKPPRGSHSIIIFCEETEPREVAGGPRLCPEPWLLDLCSLCYFTVYLTCNLIAVLIISGSVWMDFMAKDRIQKTHPVLLLWQRTLTTTLCVDYIEALAESRSLRISVWCVNFCPPVWHTVHFHYSFLPSLPPFNLLMALPAVPLEYIWNLISSDHSTAKALVPATVFSHWDDFHSLCIRISTSMCLITLRMQYNSLPGP